MLSAFQNVPPCCKNLGENTLMYIFMYMCTSFPSWCDYCIIYISLQGAVTVRHWFQSMRRWLQHSGMRNRSVSMYCAGPVYNLLSQQKLIWKWSSLPLLTYTIDNREGGGIGNVCTGIRRMLIAVTWLHQSLWIMQFRYTNKGCVCCPREGLGAPLAESPQVLKPKEERIGQFFITDL